MASSSSSRLSRSGGLLFSLCCFRETCPLLGAEYERAGLEIADRRELESKLCDGTETGCEGVKLDADTDRDLPPRLKGAALMMTESPGLELGRGNLYGIGGPEQ